MKRAALLSLLLPAVIAVAADKDETFLDPAKAGPDYAVQGEYKNDWGGSQVIALGDGKFDMVTYPGGLPGDGWKKDTKTENHGKREGGSVVFTGENGYKAEIADGKITINTANGGPYTMEKTERKSPTIGAKAPEGAVILFDGTTADGWDDGHMDDRHLLASGCRSKQLFTNFTAHVEFYLPFKPFARGQERGNSGVYVQDRYEIQVLDSFGLKGEDNECGGIYHQSAPDVNMCYPPLTWQTYDIDFTAAQYGASGTKTKNARLTVKHNGVVVQDNLELKGPTPGNGRDENPTGGPFYLQGHGNPVYFRNIWVVPK